MIDDKTLLQTDATVIAGVLILLTILLTVKPFEYPRGRQQGITPLHWAVAGFGWLTGAIIAITLVSLFGVKEKTETGQP